MKNVIVKKSKLKGSITLPTSKSQTLRALVFAMMAKGKSTIHNFLDSDDTHAMIQACRHFGATITLFSSTIQIEGINGLIKKTEDVINAKNSGILLRFCTTLGSLAKLPVVITGDDSIRHQRPMKPLIDALKQLNVSVQSMRNDDLAPLIIQGPLKPGIATLSGEDSQPVSALLIAAAFANGKTTLIVKNPGERAWVNLTLNWFDRLGIGYTHESFEHFEIEGNACYPGFDYKVPGDLSSSAFSIGAALITNSELVIENIDLQDPQGDKELISIFKKMGAIIDVDKENKQLFVRKGPTLKGIAVDINNFIDSVTLLAVVACFSEGETLIYNAAVAREKECNRLSSIAVELKKMGADIQETADGLKIKKSFLKGAHLFSHNDHRMAMSLAVAGFGAEGETFIESFDSVSKTYPTFIKDFQSIGADIKQETVFQ